MKNPLTILVLFIIPFMITPAHATTPTETLGTCLVDSLNGKERKALMKWIYFAIASHPDMQPFSTATAKDRDDSDKYVGGLITRVLTSDCPAELKAANNYDPMAINKAFEMVGRVAMQELMTNKQVITTIANYAKYVDQAKFQAVIDGQ